MSDNERLAEARQYLSKLKSRLVAGEIDEETFHRQSQLVLADLEPVDRAALGTTTPQPIAVSPRPGTVRPFGPSGGVLDGLRTSVLGLSDLDLKPGTILLDQWKLERELGRGGFGAVFAAEELHLHEKQAVKVLDPAMVAKEELLARFRREVSLMRKLVHARIVRVYDYREDLSQLVALISMELVTGGSVKQLQALARERRHPIPVPLALEILGQTLEALAEAHAQGVIHRDVTPGNVLLAGGSAEQLLADSSRDPQVKLVDFGIAGLVERTELSAKSRVLGTAAYVAPEVLDPSAEVSPAADVYGAGAMAYELLTGKLPLGRFGEPRELREEIDESVNGFVLSLLASRPEKRPLARPAARGLRELREEGEQEAERLAAEQRAAEERLTREAKRDADTRREARERAAREADAARLRQLQEEQSRQEHARRDAAERDRQAKARLEAPTGRATTTAVAPASGRAEVTRERAGRRRGAVSPGAWGAITLGFLALVIAAVWGLTSQRAVRERAEQARIEQEQQTAVTAERQQAEAAAAQERQRQEKAREAERRQDRRTQREGGAKEQQPAAVAPAEGLAPDRPGSASPPRTPTTAEPPASAASTAPTSEAQSGTDDPRAASGFWIQVHSSTDLAKAEEIAARLREAGFPFLIKDSPKQGGILRKIRVGPYGSKDDANSAAARVRREVKLDTWVTNTAW